MLDLVALVCALGLAAVWLVYPLGVAVVAALRTPRSREQDGVSLHPSVSVVLATRESPDIVRARVEDLLASESIDAVNEVVVALDRNRRGGAGDEFAMLDHRVVVVWADEPGGKAAALNAGVRAASGQMLVFADSHQRFHPAAIARLGRAFADPEVGAASGSLELATPEGPRSPVEWYWRFERWLRRAEARIHSTVGVTGAIHAVRRSLWQPLPAGLILDDVFIPMRVVLAGSRVAFVEGAVAVETRRPTSTQEYHRKVRTLTGNFQLCAWLPNLLIPWRNPIWLQFLFHKLLRLLTPWLVLGVVVWLVVTGIRWTGAGFPERFLVLALPALLVPLLMPTLARSLRSALYQGFLMQIAVVAATLNGLRGRWDVWAR
ncbi:hypothetical protein BH23GEM3_BH23GEM3_17440 [soil metagenome]